MAELLLSGLKRDHLVQLDDHMRLFLASRELPLYRMMAYQMGWIDETGEPSISGEQKDDRLHGQFVIAAASAFGADPVTAIDYAVPVELARNAALIHEDVEDGNTDRDGRPSVWWTWGPAQAINAGDGMQAMSRLSLFSLMDGDVEGGRVSAALEALDDAVLARCEGEYLDITYQERLSVTSGQYFEMAEGRTGSLVGGAVTLGAISAGVDQREALDAIRAFGRRLGTSMQIAADVAALWGERDQVSQGRLISKKKNLAILYALENGDATLRRKLGELYMQRVLDPNVIQEVAELVDSAGGREACHEAVSRLLGEADAELAGVGLSDSGRKQLSESARMAVSAAQGKA